MRRFDIETGTYSFVEAGWVAHVRLGQVSRDFYLSTWAPDWNARPIAQFQSEETEGTVTRRSTGASSHRIEALQYLGAVSEQEALLSHDLSV